MFYAFAQDISPGHTSKCVGLIGPSSGSSIRGFTRWSASCRHSRAGDGKFAPMILVAGVLPLLAALFCADLAGEARSRRKP